MNTYAEISLAAIKSNIAAIKKFISAGAKFMAVVKANAMGMERWLFPAPRSRRGPITSAWRT